MDKQQSSSNEDTGISVQQSLIQATTYHSSGSQENLQRSASASNSFDLYHKAMPTMQKIEGEKRSASGPTTILHEEEDGKPAITLTTYMVKLPERHAANFRPGSLAAGANSTLLQIHHDDHFTGDIQLAFDHAEAQDAATALEKLSLDLNEHFERLKSEYEHKRGRNWAPLRSFDQKY